MGPGRCELIGFGDGEVEQLTTLGLYAEIISYGLRLFMPDTDSAVATLAALIRTRPVTRAVQAAA